MVGEFIRAVEKAIEKIYSWPQKRVYIYHHNDADGLCSGAILASAFQRKGYGVKRACLEKPYPAILEKIYRQQGEILIFADFAGRIAPLLSRLNQGRNLTIILDHHVAREATDQMVYNLDPDLFGLKGDRDISASTTCYIFARTMDEHNIDLAHIGALGAVGDGFFVQGRLVSENRRAALEAAGQGRLEIVESVDGEEYMLETAQGKISCVELGDYLDILGGAGYNSGGPDAGIEVCLKGPDAGSDKVVECLKIMKEDAFTLEIEKLKRGSLIQSPHIQWFNLERRFYPMGVKMVGVFCETLKEQQFIDPHKYIAGFQIIPDEIPGFDPVDMSQVKISMRVLKYLEQQIGDRGAMGLDVLLPQATSELGGFSDACHSLTAATTVAIGLEEKLIGEMEKLITAFGKGETIHG